MAPVSRVLFVLFFLLTSCGEAPKSATNVSQAAPVITETPEPLQEYSVLYLGDSQSSLTPFSRTLNDFFSNLNAQCAQTPLTVSELRYYALPSSSPRHWGAVTGTDKNWLCSRSSVYTNQSPDEKIPGTSLCLDSEGVSVFQKLVRTSNPLLLVLQFGDNSLAFGKDFVVEKIHTLLAELKPEDLCFWISPTWGSQRYVEQKRRMQTWIDEAIQLSGKSCTNIHSLEALSEQSHCPSFYVSDGIHLTQCGSELWGRYITDQLCRNLKSLKKTAF